jgi:hypothetical protein
MRKPISLVLICGLVVSGSAGLGAQAAAGAAGQGNGVISGSVSSTTGRALSGMTMQLVDSKGTQVGKPVTTAANGTFKFDAVAYDTYTVQCMQNQKVRSTQSVILKGPTESIKMTCGTDTVAAFYKHPGVITGLAAAAAVAGAAAVRSGGGVDTRSAGGDASGSR